MIAVGGVVALLLWFIFAGQPDATPPSNATQPVGTSGTAAVERVPGSTSGVTAERDQQYFPRADRYESGKPVAYFDRQPLFVAADNPIVSMPDDKMILEEHANEQQDGAKKYGLYVPAADAAGQTSARFYYLKLADGQYLKVTLSKP